MHWIGQVSGIFLASLAIGFAVCPSSAPAQQPIDEALAAAYGRLKADPSLQDEQARHRMLMEMADQYSQYAEAAFQATEDLQSYAAKVRATGLMFRTPLAKVKQFSEIKERIRSWHKALGLPVEYNVLNKLIRIEIANPGGVERALRARVLRAYPGFAAYLASAGEDPQSLDIAALIERFSKYRSGEQPSGTPVALGAHLMASIPADLPAGWRQPIAPNRAPDPKLTGVPQHKPNPGSPVEWWQWFTITNEPGIEWRSHMFVVPSKKRQPEFVSVSIGLQPQFYTWAEGKTYPGDQREGLEGRATNKAINCRWMDDAKTSVLHVVNDSHVEIHFVRGGVYASVNASFPKSPRTPYTQADCEALARHFAQVVAGKIDGKRQ